MSSLDGHSEEYQAVSDATETRIRPVRNAAILAIGFLSVSAAYVLLSDRFVSAVLSDPKQIQQIQSAKGLLFVGLTSAFLFVVAWRYLGRICHANEALTHHQEALLVSEQRAMAGILAASVAHDINNALTGIGAELELLLESDDAASPDVRDAIIRVERQCNGLANLSRRLISTGRETVSGEFQAFDVVELLRECGDVVRIKNRSQSFEYTIAGPESLSMSGNPAILRQLFINLFLNASEASEQGVKIRVKLRRLNDELEIEVEDNGPGIPENHRGRVFDPFFTTKESGNGLGLVSVRACAQMHGGRVVLLEPEGIRGACFVITLPLDGSQTPVPPMSSPLPVKESVGLL